MIRRPIRHNGHEGDPQKGRSRVLRSPNQLTPDMLWSEQRLAEIVRDQPTVQRSNTPSFPASDPQAPANPGLSRVRHKGGFTSDDGYFLQWVTDTGDSGRYFLDVFSVYPGAEYTVFESRTLVDKSQTSVNLSIHKHPSSVDHAIILGWQTGGVDVIDLTDPTSPSVANVLASYGDGSDGSYRTSAVVIGNSLLVSDANNTVLTSVDASSTSSMSVDTSVAPDDSLGSSGTVMTLSSDGDTLFVWASSGVGGYSSYHVGNAYDVSDPTAPTFICPVEVFDASVNPTTNPASNYTWQLGDAALVGSQTAFTLVYEVDNTYAGVVGAGSTNWTGLMVVSPTTTGANSAGAVYTLGIDLFFDRNNGTQSNPLTTDPFTFEGDDLNGSSSNIAAVGGVAIVTKIGQEFAGHFTLGLGYSFSVFPLGPPDAESSKDDASSITVSQDGTFAIVTWSPESFADGYYALFYP